MDFVVVVLCDASWSFEIDELSRDGGVVGQVLAFEPRARRHLETSYHS
jgi:hypothetical protein